MLAKALIPKVVFVLAVLSLIGPTVPATLNYLEFYPTLGSIETQITEISWVNGTDSVTITMRMVVVSRGEYRGLALVNLGASVLFDVNGTSHRIRSALRPQASLSPNTPLDLEMRLSEQHALAALFVKWASSQEGNEWTVELSYAIKTFFGENPLPISFRCTYPGSCVPTLGFVPSPPVGSGEG